MDVYAAVLYGVRRFIAAFYLFSARSPTAAFLAKESGDKSAFFRCLLI
jgi:hypothetical protein